MEEGITGSTKTRQRRVRPLFLDKEKGPGVVGTGTTAFSYLLLFFPITHRQDILRISWKPFLSITTAKGRNILIKRQD